MTTVFLVRHAQSDNANSNQVLRALTEIGQEGAQRVAETLAKQKIQAIYASSYLRTQETMQPLADRLGLPITNIHSLRERELPEEFFLEDFDQFMVQQWMDRNYALPYGESLRQVQERTVETLHRILSTNPNGIIAIGSHGCAMSVLLDALVPFGYEGYRAMLPKAPCIYRLQFEGLRFEGMEEITLL